MDVANRQEQYKIDARSYSSQLSQLGYATVPTEVSANYQVTVAADNTVAPPTYSIRATPIGTQLARDTACGTLAVDQTGARTISGTSVVSKCW